MVRSSYSTSGTCREKLFLWCSFQYKTRQNNLVFLGPWLYHKWIYIYLCIQCLKLASKRFPHVIRCTRSSFTIILWCIRQWSMHNSKICLTLRICSTIVPLLQGHSFCNKQKWLYKRGGLWVKVSYKRGGLWMKVFYKRETTI
jgi:hypothetical protein